MAPPFLRCNHNPNSSHHSHSHSPHCIIPFISSFSCTSTANAPNDRHSASNDRIEMMAAMRAGVNLQKVVEMDPLLVRVHSLENCVFCWGGVGVEHGTQIAENFRNVEPA
jgi:hypothetical protein